MNENFIEKFDKNEKKKGSILFILYILIIIFGGNILGLLGNQFLISNTTFVCYCILSITILILFGNILKDSMIKLRIRIARKLIVLFAIGFITIVFMLISSIVISNLNIINQNQVEVDYALTNQRTLMLITTCLLAPITEEIVYRYILFRTIRKYSIVLSHLITSLLFGFLHVWFYVIIEKNLVSILTMLPTFFIGLGCSILYDKTKNIIFPILLHIAINMMSSL